MSKALERLSLKELLSLGQCFYCENWFDSAKLDFADHAYKDHLKTCEHCDDPVNVSKRSYDQKLYKIRNNE
jgi:hypothetical protein